MAGVDKTACLTGGSNLFHGNVRMKEEQAQQLSAHVARAANDGYSQSHFFSKNG
jgi:hypothetical protein